MAEKRALTPEELEARKERERERSRAKKRRKRARERAERIAVAQANGVGFSKTSAEYRRKLPPAEPMTPAQKRALIAQALANTAAMQS